MRQPNGLHAGSGLGETHSVSGGIREKRVHVGPGYWVCFARSRALSFLITAAGQPGRANDALWLSDQAANETKELRNCIGGRVLRLDNHR
jgi:putative component of toxin-antitoxin plasmid stabilization module